MALLSDPPRLTVRGSLLATLAVVALLSVACTSTKHYKTRCYAPNYSVRVAYTHISQWACVFTDVLCAIARCAWR